MAEIVRDAKTGRITRGPITSETAAEYVKTREAKKGIQAATEQELLTWAGFDSPEAAPPDVRLLIQDAVRSGRAPAATLREIRALVGMDKGGAGQSVPVAGEICQLCGSLVGDLPGAVLVRLLALLDTIEAGPVPAVPAAGRGSAMPASGGAPAGAAVGRGSSRTRSKLSDNFHDLPGGGGA